MDPFCYLCFVFVCDVFLVFLSLSHMMRNAGFGPLTLLMTLRVIDVKSDDKFTRLFYVSVHDANIRF